MNNDKGKLSDYFTKNPVDIKLSDIPQPVNVWDLGGNSSQMEKELAEAYEEKERYKKDVLNTLKNIESNTLYLKEMHVIVKENTQHQEEILKIYNQMFEMATANDKNEARTKYRKALDTAKNFTGDIETTGKLMKLIQDAYEFLPF
ncbi:hypothetical protein ACJA3J_05860 [Halobacillus sp. SY10]|uniref:hypothetical protein n=1 Tax=Halobacillus sp. SY10 TaxID=3381356 RepID=UPI00387A2CED